MVTYRTVLKLMILIYALATTTIAASTASTSTTTATPRIETTNFTLTLKVAMNVSSVDLSDPNSENYKYLKGNCTESLRKAFNTLSVKGLKDVIVTNLRAGSLIIDFTVVVNISENPTPQSNFSAVVAYIGTTIVIGGQNFVTMTDACDLLRPVCAALSQTCEKDSSGIAYCTPPKSSANVTAEFNMTLKIEMDVSSVNFSNPNSTEYIKLKENCTDALRKEFNKTVKGLKEVIVTNLRVGSLIIDFTVVVNITENPTPQSNFSNVVTAIKTGIKIGDNTFSVQTDTCSLLGQGCTASQTCVVDSNGSSNCKTMSSANDIRQIVGLVVGLPLFASWWTFSY